MKKIIAICALAAWVYSCTPKANPAGSAESAKPSREVAAGQMVFEEKCGRCHDIPKPSHHTEAEWKPIMDRMAIKAKLDSTQKANVLAYILFYAKGV